MSAHRWGYRAIARYCFVLSAVILQLVAGSDLHADDKVLQAATRDYNSAAENQNLGSFELAAKKWADFIAKYPKDKRLDRAHYYLGYCRIQTKDYDGAAQAFRTVLDRYKTFAKLDGAQFYVGRALYEKATQTNNQQDLTAAATAFGEVARRWPQSSYAHRALFYQGDALLSLGDAAAAAQSLSTLVAKYPDGPLLARAYYNLGVAQQQNQQHEQAIKTFRDFLGNKKFGNDPLMPEVQLRLGLVLFSQGQYAEAEQLFGKAAAAKDFPHADLALLRQGLCRVETGKLADATPLFASVLQKSPNGPYAVTARLAAGKCHFLTDQWDKAIEILKPLSGNKDPEGAEGCYWLARTLLKKENINEAVALLDKAVQTHTEGEFVPYLQLTRIDALRQLENRRAETPALYAAFCKQFADHSLALEALYMAAVTALEQRDYPAARKHTGQFLGNRNRAKSELLPNVLFIAAEANLLGLDADDQAADAAQAETLYRQLVAKHPDHPKAGRSHLRIAFLLDRAKKSDEVIKYLASVAARLQDSTHSAEAHLLTARAHRSLGKFNEAVSACDAALKAKSDWKRADEVLLEMAESYRELGKADDAVKQLGRLTADYKQSPYRSQALFLAGEILRDGKKNNEAIQQYEELLKSDAQNTLVPAARLGMASAYLALGDDDKAAAALNELISAGQDEQAVSSGRYLRGLVSLRGEKYAEALRDLQEFVNGTPADDEAASARFTMVLCQIGLKQFDDAKAALDQLLQGHGDHPQAKSVCYEFGHALLKAEQSPRAAVAFQTLAERWPDSPLAPEAWFRVGTFHEQTARETDAEEAAAKAAALGKAAEAFRGGIDRAKDPAIREKLQYKLGDVQFQLGKYADAAATLQAQIKELPEGKLAGPARFLIAESLFRGDQYEQALPLLLQVIQDNDEQYRADALYRAGTCETKLRHWPESQKYFQQLIDQYKDFDHISDARYGLGWALQNQDKLDEALTAYKQVANETDGEPAAKAKFMIGQIAFARGKHEEAIDNFVQVSLNYPYPEWQALAQYETGRCLMDLGRKPQAKAALKKFVERFPDHANVEKATRLIAELEK